jgi:hypothetical protein
MGQNKEQILKDSIMDGELVEPIIIDLRPVRDDPSLLATTVRPVLKEVLGVIPEIPEKEKFVNLHGLNEIAENTLRHSDNGSKIEIIPTESSVIVDISNTIDPEAFPEGELELDCGERLSEGFHYETAEDAPEHGYGCRTARRVFKEKYKVFVRRGILHSIVELP